MIDGINAEFFAKVAVTSLAIQGPQIGGGIWNSIQSEVISKREAKELWDESGLEKDLDEKDHRCSIFEIYQKIFSS